MQLSQLDRLSLLVLPSEQRRSDYFDLTATTTPKKEMHHHRPVFNTNMNMNMNMNMNTTTTPMRTTKRLRFSPFLSVSAPSPLAFEETRQLWYGQDELSAFRKESKRALKCPDEIMLQAKDDNDDGDDERIEGIGHCCKDRLTYSRMTLQCILSASKKGVGMEIIAAIAKRCNTWSAEAAHIRAVRSYCELYQPPHMILSQLPNVPSVPKFPFSMKKRKSASVTTTERSTAACLGGGGGGGDQYIGQPHHHSHSASPPKRRTISLL